MLGIFWEEHWLLYADSRCWEDLHALHTLLVSPSHSLHCTQQLALGKPDSECVCNISFLMRHSANLSELWTGGHIRLCMWSPEWGRRVDNMCKSSV